jgi:ribosome-associated translation inhibitor RaiA
MTITIEGLNHNRALRELILRKFDVLGQRVRPAPVSARVAFTDENGPKGGNDTRCAVTVDVPRRPALHVEDLADSPRLAFDAAFSGLERLVRRERGATLEQGRRPKKYYVAKRLLESDSAGGHS